MVKLMEKKTEIKMDDLGGKTENPTILGNIHIIIIAEHCRNHNAASTDRKDDNQPLHGPTWTHQTLVSVSASATAAVQIGAWVAFVLMVFICLRNFLTFF